MDGRTDGWVDYYVPPFGGIKTSKRHVQVRWRQNRVVPGNVRYSTRWVPRRCSAWWGGTGSQPEAASHGSSQTATTLASWVQGFYAGFNYKVSSQKSSKHALLSFPNTNSLLSKQMAFSSQNSHVRTNANSVVSIIREKINCTHRSSNPWSLIRYIRKCDCKFPSTLSLSTYHSELLQIVLLPQTQHKRDEARNIQGERDDTMVRHKHMH